MKSWARSLSVRALVGALICGITGTSAYAAPSCMTAAEAEADQAIKMHTELMVIGLTCIRDGISAFPHYQRFTNAHVKAIREYEATLIGYMKKNYRDNATRRFDKLRTDLANDLAISVVRMTTEKFCSTGAAKLEQMIAYEPAEFRAAAVEAAMAGSSQTCGARAEAEGPAKGALAELQRDKAAKPAR